MAEAVKTRRYDSARRRAQAEATRRDILHAAQRLFEEHGYAATTMAAIAAESHVALKTVYVAFETKSGVLRALWNLRLRGDDDALPVAQQDWYQEVVAEPDPRRQLRMNARNSRAVKERIGPLLEVIGSAAAVDPDIEGLWKRIGSEFHANQRVIVESLARRKALKRGLDVDRATDILWALNHPNMWQMLVGDRGWSPDEYESWFAETAEAQLLKAPTGADAPRRRRAS
jgi:AcrR family transcriptional regulator